MKLVIFGGSAQSTPALIDYFSRQSSLPSLDVSLVSPASSRLQAVERAARISEAAPISIGTSTMSTNAISRVLDGADFVLVQIRPGGDKGRHFDETFPLEFDVCGDEGLGPGGLSAAWRTWPYLEQIFHLIDAKCPDAQIVLLSSPVSLLTRLVNRTFPQLHVFGICELPWTTLQEICESVEIDPSDLSYDYLGINHIGWFYRLEAGSRN